MELADCAACGQTFVADSARCWRCGYPTVKSLERPAPGLSAVASVFVVISVFAVVLLGVVVFVQREYAIAAHREGIARSEAAASARAEADRQAADLERRIASRPSPTPLPSDAPGTYAVRDGDSLFEIAAAFGVSPQALREWNRDTYPELTTGVGVKPGWVLVLIGPAIAAAPAPPPDPVLPPGAEFVAAGGEAVIDADDVVVRTRPSRASDSRIIGSLDTGTRVSVLAGPLPGSGYFWYQIQTPSITGWVAAGTASDPWIVAAAPNAPVGGGTAAIPDQTASIAGATIRYYDIYGSTHIDLINQAIDLGPDNGYDDVIASARISFSFEPYLAVDQNPNGTTSWPACRVSVLYDVILPRWVGPSPASPTVVSWWAGAFALARNHEAGHVAIWNEQLPALISQTGPEVVDPDCQQARMLKDYWLQVVGVAHDQFHADEIAAGRTWPPPYVGP